MQRYAAQASIAQRPQHCTEHRDELTPAGFGAAVEANLNGTFRACHALQPLLAAAGGAIVNLASTAARRWDAKGYAAYAAVKEAIRAITRGAASAIYTARRSFRRGRGNGGAGKPGRRSA